MDREQIFDQETGEPLQSAPAPQKRVIGRPFTKENAKAAALSATRARKMRKETRNRMLKAMCEQLNLDEELVKAIKTNDEVKMNIVEKALHIVGLHYDQSEEGKMNLWKGDLNNKQSGSVKLVIEDLTKPVDET